MFRTKFSLSPLCIFSLGLLLVLGCENISSTANAGPTAVAMIRVQATGTAEARQAFRQTQTALLKSPFVMNAALRLPEAQACGIIRGQERPVEWLMKNLQVEFVEDSDILQVGLENESTKEAIMLVNIVVDAYITEVASAQRNEFAESLEIRRAEHRSNYRDMMEMSEALHKLESETGASSNRATMIKRELQLDRVRALSKRIVTLEDELINEQIGILSGADGVTKKRGTAIKQVLEEQRQKLAESENVLLDMHGFSAEAEQKRMELEFAKERAGTLSRQIHEIETNLKKPAKVQLIQRATLLNE